MKKLSENLFKRAFPITKEEYKILLIETVNNINIDFSEDYLIEKYNIYLDVFQKFKNKELLSYYKYNTFRNLGIFGKSCRKSEYWINRGYNEDQIKSKISDIQSTSKIEKCAKRWNCTEEEARLKWKGIHSDKRERLTKTGEWEIACDKMGGFKLKNVIKRINPDTNKLYTEAEAKEWIHYTTGLGGKNRVVVPGMYNTSLLYYINKGFSEKESIELLKERQQTFTLEKNIKRHGEIEGRKRFEDRQKRWQNTLNQKSDAEKLDILIRKLKRFGYYSIQSYKFFESIVNELDIKDSKMYFGPKEYYLHDGLKIYFYDFCISDLKIIIEYNGSHCHPNKSKLSEDDWNKWKNVYNKSQTADIKYAMDQYKLQVAKGKGFDVYEVWDTDNLTEQKECLINIIKEKYSEFIKTGNN